MKIEYNEKSPMYQLVWHIRKCKQCDKAAEEKDIQKSISLRCKEGTELFLKVLRDNE
jgi:hypothetical protein